eukprot:5971689-Prymnesium_polylepis.1
MLWTSTSLRTTAYGLWPMMRRVAVSGATRAPRCRGSGWHEVRVDERTVDAPCLWPMVAYGLWWPTAYGAP